MDLYRRHCAPCHGKNGEGNLAPPLRSEGLLQTVDIDYFIKTIRFGRPIRGCPQFEGKLEEKDIKTIASYIKAWQRGKTLPAPSHTVEPVWTPGGEMLFALCGGCHGLEGEGAMGPPLLDRGLLMSISDEELRRTIMWGRPGTPMKGYIKGQGGMATLTPEEIDEVISYLRYRQRISR